MGVRVGRIVKEYVFKSLQGQEGRIELRGNKKRLGARFLKVNGGGIVLEPIEGDLAAFSAGEPVRAFFSCQNNYYTFESAIVELSLQRLLLKDPEGVYKNPQRKYERIQLQEPAEVTFTLRGEKVELGFPRFDGFAAMEEPRLSEQFDARSIQGLLGDFRSRISRHAQTNHILMMRGRVPTRYEEKVLAATGRIFWIPSVEEDFPLRDPFPEERIVTKRDLVRFEESLRTPPQLISSKLGNLLFEKQQKGIYSEVYCPVLYNEYLVGYIHLANAEGRRERIGKDVVAFVYQFAQVLAHSLKANGYFSAGNAGEQRYKARIIDISAAGLLFLHPRVQPVDDLAVHTDLDLVLHLNQRKITIGSCVRRKFQDNEFAYFGIQFMKIDPEDFRFLFELLYGKPFRLEEEGLWEGGAPPPKLELFDG